MNEYSWQEYCNRVRKLEKRVKALEQEPCEDTVSRQAVLEIIKSHIFTDDYLAVEQLPSIQPKAKTGCREYNDIYDHYLCGNCKTIVADYDNYCPNCGAEMKGGAE